MLSLVAFIGVVIVAVGFAIDRTILIALSEAADDIIRSAVQALQALWDNDFVPMVVGVLLFLWAHGDVGVPHRRAAEVARLGDDRARVVGVTPLGFAR